MTNATDPRPRLGVVMQDVVVAPCTMPLALVHVRLHPLSRLKVPPTVMPVPAAFEMA